jgi:DNA (cytosine-5)-methyltransferase 1
MSNPSVLSLYTGAGGLDYGLEAAGFDVAVAIDIDHDSCETVRRNRSWRVIEASVQDVSTDRLLAEAGLRPGEVDLLIGGPPCQPFSKSGYWAHGDTRRLRDPRADTLTAYLRVLEEALPRAFLLENVDGLAYAGKREGLDSFLAIVEEINRKTGTRYRPAWKVLNAASFGVPQVRRRLFVVASRDGQDFTFPRDLAEVDPSQKRRLTAEGVEYYRTAWDALADAHVDDGEELSLRGKWARLLPSIPEGQNYLRHTDRGDGLPLFGWRRRYWGFLLKLAKDRPSWTIQAQPGPAIGPFHWHNRRLSRHELCRLQTFPDDIRIFGRRSSVQRQVGNAVPSLLAEVLGRAIRTTLLGLGPMDGPLKLLPADRSPAPASEPVEEVPREYRGLAGEHAAHPGTGLGHSARRRPLQLALNRPA